MYRNFIKTPKVLSFTLLAALYLCFIILIPWYGLIANFLFNFAFGYLALMLVDRVSEFLTRKRIEKWAFNYYGVDPENLESWLEGIEPEELDAMMSMDLEGWEDMSFL